MVHVYTENVKLVFRKYTLICDNIKKRKKKENIKNKITKEK